MNKGIVIKQNLIRQFFLSFSGIVMLIMSIFTFFTTENILFRIVGIIGILFFGLCCIYTIWCLFNRKDILIINNDGFTDNSSAVSVGTVLWDDVKAIYISHCLSIKFICVEVKNIDQLLYTLPPLKQKLIRANMAINTAFGYSQIQIPLTSTKANYEDVLETMKRYYNYALQEHNIPYNNLT